LLAYPQFPIIGIRSKKKLFEAENGAQFVEKRLKIFLGIFGNLCWAMSQLQNHRRGSLAADHHSGDCKTLEAETPPNGRILCWRAETNLKVVFIHENGINDFS